MEEREGRCCVSSFTPDALSHCRNKARFIGDNGAGGVAIMCAEHAEEARAHGWRVLPMVVAHAASDFESSSRLRAQVALWEETRQRQGGYEASRIPGSRTWLVFKNGNRQLYAVGPKP